MQEKRQSRVVQKTSPSSEKGMGRDLESVLRTDFGRTWLQSALKVKGEPIRTAVFVEGNSLQYFARGEFGKEFAGADLRRLITPQVHEPFEIEYYVDTENEQDKRKARKLESNGVRIHIVNRGDPYRPPQLEEQIFFDARDIIPVLDHLVLISGYPYKEFDGLLALAKKAGCETTIISFSARKKYWKFTDHLVNIRTAWAEVSEKTKLTEDGMRDTIDLSKRPRVVILPVRLDEEEAIFARLAVVKEPFKGRHGLYKLGKIRRGKRSMTVAVKRIMEQGNLQALVAANNAIEDLNPDWVVLLGIGGGIPASEYTLGDVIVATRVHDFSLGAYKEDGRSSTELSNQGGPMSRKTHDLIDYIPQMQRIHPPWNPKKVNRVHPSVDLADEKFYGSEKWRSDTKSSLEYHFLQKPRRPPLFWPAPIGGDSFLIKDSKIVAAWRKHARDIGAFDMELSGVYNAARKFEKEYPVICIRGISDIVGYKRDHGWTLYACDSAAAFCFWLLKYMPDTYFDA
jgi:nucleoside phosphorylase/uncharacterized LabA/DUF88 family protein